MLGAKGSGKTLIGRALAKKFGVFHISFHNRLQELIIAKTKKRIGPDYPEEVEEEDEVDENEQGKQLDGSQTTLGMLSSQLLYLFFLVWHALSLSVASFHSRVETTQRSEPGTPKRW